MFARCGWPAPSARSACHELAQLAERVHFFEQPGALDDAEPLLDGCGKLHASQAVEVQIFGQAQLIAHAGVGFAGDLRDEREQPVGGGPEAARQPWCVCDVPSLVGRRSGLNAGQPCGHGLAPDFSCGGARQIGLRPQHPAADALKLGQLGVGALDGCCGLHHPSRGRPVPRTAPDRLESPSRPPRRQRFRAAPRWRLQCPRGEC